MGGLIFDLPTTTKRAAWSPTFRSLVSYFTRFRRDSYLEPFRHFQQQARVDIQVNTAFLLGLNWEYPRRNQSLLDDEERLKNVRKLGEKGILPEYQGSPGKLAAERLQRVQDLESLKSQLKTFKVHPQYRAIQESADRLTKKIQAVNNDITIQRRLTDIYQNSLESEVDADPKDVERVYNGVGLVFPERLSKTLADLVAFHRAIVTNRKSYLEAEMERIKQLVEEELKEVARLTEERSGFMQILSSHGALEEFVLLQTRATQLASEIDEMATRIAYLTSFQEGRARLKAEKLTLERSAVTDLSERRNASLKEPMNLFAHNSKALYEKPGTLSVDSEGGWYRFAVDTERSKSGGYIQMGIFCYDLMLAQLRSKSPDHPGFLIHDGMLFAEVDPRQVSKALSLAYEDARTRGYQYICALNSYELDDPEFDPQVRDSLQSTTAIALGDRSPSESLLGFRF